MCPGPWDCACFYPRLRHRSDGLHILSLDFQHDPSWGRPARRLLLLFVSWQDWHDWLLPISNFFKMYLNTLDIFLRCILSRVWSGQLFEGSAPLLRVLSFLMCPTFLVGVPKSLGNLSNCSCTSLILYLVWYLRVYLFLLPGLQVPYHLFGGVSLWGILLAP